MRNDLHVRISDELRARLDTEAEARGLSINKIIDRACALWLDTFALVEDVRA